MAAKQIIVGIVTLVVIAGVLVAVIVWRHNSLSTQTAATASPLSTPSGLQITDITAGTGAAAASGSTVTVSYTGTLTNGTQFDTSNSFSFTVGGGQVIKGWDEGLLGMKVGGERKLVIPPNLGYGSQATGSIPPNSTLIFDIKLLSIK